MLLCRRQSIGHGTLRCKPGHHHHHHHHHQDHQGPCETSSAGITSQSMTSSWSKTIRTTHKKMAHHGTIPPAPLALKRHLQLPLLWITTECSSWTVDDSISFREIGETNTERKENRVQSVSVAYLSVPCFTDSVHSQIESSTCVQQASLCQL